MREGRIFVLKFQLQNKGTLVSLLKENAFNHTGHESTGGCFSQCHLCCKIMSLKVTLANLEDKMLLAKTKEWSNGFYIILSVYKANC